MIQTTRKICLAACLNLAHPLVQAESEWEALQFEVFAGNPWVGSALAELAGSYDWIETEDWTYTISDETKAEIERAFNEAGAWYRERGFPAPALGPPVDTENGPAYRVYVCSYELDRKLWDSALNLVNEKTGQNWAISLPHIEPEFGRCGGPQGNLAEYIGQCLNEGRTEMIYVNKDAALDGKGRLTELGAQTLAHELVHAMVPGTRFGGSARYCDSQGWIEEGLADAIAWDLAEKLWSGRYAPATRKGDIGKRWGFRPYHIPLPQPAKIKGAPGNPPDVEFNIGYRTSSFWRFLADAHPQGWSVLIRAGGPGPKGILDHELEGTGWKKEVNWLDKSLRANFKVGLNALYSAFLGHFSYSIAPASRYTPLLPDDGGLDVEKAVETWVNDLYEECQSVDFKAAAEEKVDLDISALAARCVWVEPADIDGGIQVTFQAEHESERLLDDIWIGLVGTTVQVRASMVGEHPEKPGQYLATWKDFPQDGNEWTLYVVTNAARVPAETEDRELRLSVSWSSNTNSARGNLPSRKHIPAPVKPGHVKHAKTLSQQRGETRKMINQQMESDKDSLSEHISSGTIVTRHSNQRACRDPFKYSPCGPHMSFTLSVRPGTYLMPGQANAQGGMAAQVMAGFQAMAQTSVMDSPSAMTTLEARLDAIDGSEVRIQTPLFDYGFTGEFDNAAIRIRMRGGRWLSAIGPPNAEGRSRLTGKVTIEEYSPFVVRGRFVAPLAEVVESASGEGIYQPRQTVTGTFNSVAPWQHDERTRIVYDTEEVLREDIANALGVGDMGGFTPGGDQAPGGEVGPGTGNSSTGGSLGTPECNCECDTREIADELCFLLCEEEFAACEDPQ